MFKYIPRELIERPKTGFGVPIDSWLRGPLKDWANELLSKENIEKTNYLNYKPIRKIWDDHLSCNFQNSGKLWPILMWQSWLNNYKSSKNLLN